METLTFRKVRSIDQTDENALKVMLFLDKSQDVCGWFLGPVSISADGIDMPYLPRSERVRASVAIVRAVEVANAAMLQVIIVDPDDLWESAWRH